MSTLRDTVNLLHTKLSFKIAGHLHQDEKEMAFERLKKRGYSVLDLMHDSKDEFAGRIVTGGPIFGGRMGSTEAGIVDQYLQIKCKLRKKYNPGTLEWLFSTSGFFCEEDKKIESVNRFSELMISCFPDCDYLSTYWPGMRMLYYPIIRHMQNTTLIATSGPSFSDFGPYPDVPIDNTWLKALTGKRVLVVSSFPDSIKKQYARKSELTDNPACVLPDFDLLTYCSYSTQMGNHPAEFTDYFQVLDKMTDDISKIDFDIALVGAGAYSFPLARNIKKMGKSAITTCGVTPLFFGVYGQRWIDQGYEKYIHKNWIRPIEEPPKDYKKIENGCYW